MWKVVQYHWPLEVKSLSCVQLFATPWTVAYQAPLSMEFSRQEYWSGLPFPLPGDLPDPGIEPSLPHCRQTLYHLSHHWPLGKRKFKLLWNNTAHLFSSVQCSRSVMFDSLWPHESQHAKPPCPSPTPGVYSNLCPLSWWCHPAISSSVVPFSSCPQSLPASGSFPMNQLFAWGIQSTGVSASASVLPVNTQDWSPLGWTGWISLQSKWLK